jgi:hypothetical protein
MRDRNVTELIGRTYDAAQDESLWLGLAPRIAETFDSNSTVVYLRDRSAAGALVLSATENFGPISRKATINITRNVISGIRSWPNSG